MHKRTLCISDIHGMYDKFCELLKVAQYNPSTDNLILLGDYIDRGSKSKNVVEMIYNLHNEWNIICLRGNHENMFLDFIDGCDYSNFLRNGGLQTMESYFGTEWNIYDEGIIDEIRSFIKTHYKHHIDLIRQLKYYHEDDEFIYVHAGINPMYEDWKLTTPGEMTWIRDMFIFNRTNLDKTVIFGHTPTVNIHPAEDIWFGEDKIGIDGGCAYGFQLNCLEIGEEGYKVYSV